MALEEDNSVPSSGPTWGTFSSLWCLLCYAQLQWKLCMVWRNLMSELESRLQNLCPAAPDCSPVISLKLGLDLHRELITVFSKTTNIVIWLLFSSSRDCHRGTCPCQPDLIIDPLLLIWYAAGANIWANIWCISFKFTKSRTQTT